VRLDAGGNVWARNEHLTAEPERVDETETGGIENADD